MFLAIYFFLMKILNLYAGIGGNRKLWGDNHEITAVELCPKIAKKYSELYPNDTLIVGDAHEYLINNFQNFDFIWASPPCQTHSRINYLLNKTQKVRYIDAKLIQEIVLLQNNCEGLFCVENVISYYPPIIMPSVTIGRHYFWSNFKICPIKQANDEIGRITGKNRKYKNITERNAVNSELALHILKCAESKEYAKNYFEPIALFSQ